MTGDDILAASQMYQDHQKDCSVCNNELDICPIGAKLLQLFYQSLIDAIAAERIDPTKRKPPKPSN